MEKTNLPTIHKTNNYDKFSFLMGNRDIVHGHVVLLQKNILRHNLLPYEPILVNEKFQIIDGQHRFHAAKNNKLPIYYVIGEGLGLADVQMLNSNTRNWSASDYLSSYAKQGIKEYQLMQSWADMFKINVSTILQFIRTYYNSDTFKNFKKGIVTFDYEPDEIEETLRGFYSLKSYCEPSVFTDRDFARAVKKLFEKTSSEELIAKMNMGNLKIEYRDKIRGYLREFEEILNYRNRVNITRLF